MSNYKIIYPHETNRKIIYLQSQLDSVGNNKKKLYNKWLSFTSNEIHNMEIPVFDLLPLFYVLKQSRTQFNSNADVIHALLRFISTKDNGKFNHTLYYIYAGEYRRTQYQQVLKNLKNNYYRPPSHSFNKGGIGYQKAKRNYNSLL